jgi:glycosyltransferase involved in cell wall biosynthesis
VHGFSTINERMLCELRQKDVVRVFDRAPGRGGLLARLGRELAGLARFGLALGRDRSPSLYLGLSGGPGQVVDALYLFLARLGCRQRVIHHHSYAYLSQPSPLTRLCLAGAGPALHVVLCRDMAERLSQSYGIPEDRILVLSNVVFMEEARPAHPGERPALRLGFLSHVTEAKGVFRFLEIVRLLQTQGLPVEGLVAGPVDPGLQDRFDRELAATPGARHLGPVYGEEKQAFLRGLDALVFPTRYRNEAEPVVVLEALREGVPVLSTRRGCIAAQLEGQLLPALPEEGFELEAANRLQRLWLDPGHRAEARRKAIQGFHALRERHRATLEGVLTRFQGADPHERRPL